MVNRKICRVGRVHNPQHVIGASSGAIQQQNPGTLEIGDPDDLGHQLIVFGGNCDQPGPHKLLMSQWIRKEGGAKQSRPDPTCVLQLSKPPAGTLPPRFHNCVLPS